VTHRTIHIRGWRVDVFIEDNANAPYNIQGHFNEMDEVIDCVIGIGANDDIVEKATRMLSEGNPNQAFTYSNGRRTVIWIGKTTSAEEFINSMIHELRHLVDHIAEYYSLDNNEAVGYLSGDAAFMLAEDICEHGCRHCNQTQ
jgi:hypothetical protein